MVYPIEIEPAASEPGLLERLTGAADELLASSRALREAVVERDADRVWDVLAAQEEQALRFEEYARLWQDLNGAVPKASETEEIQVLRARLVELRGVQRANAGLVHGFLSAIRRALNTLGRETRPQAGVYNARGRSGHRPGAVVVNRIG
jgi:hypothetical protein